MKYIVKLNNDGVGYYVVEMVGDIELFIKAVSLNYQEMVDLANKLNTGEE